MADMTTPAVRLRTCPSITPSFVAFRSAKGRSFTERKTTLFLDRFSVRGNIKTGEEMTKIVHLTRRRPFHHSRITAIEAAPQHLAVDPVFPWRSGWSHC